MKIRYNISSNRKIDYVKLAILCMALLALSIFFIVFGIRNLQTKDQKLKNAKEKQAMYEAKLSDMYEKTEKYNKEIRSFQRKWGSKVRFTNTLVSKKAASVISTLDIIEELLPVGVYIRDISMRVEGKAGLTMTLISNSYPNLFEVYKNLSKYDPTILNESVKNGIYNSKINLRIKSDHGKKE